MWQIGLAFLLGHCCIHALAQLPAPRSWGCVLLAGLGIAALARSRLLAAFLIGIAWAWLNGAARLADDLPTTLEGQELLVRGYVASLPRSAPTGTLPANPPPVNRVFLFDVSEAVAGVPPRIRLTWYEAPAQPRPGESWQFLVRLKRRNGFANPGGFDFEGHQFREGIGASGYIREDSRNQRLQPASCRYAITRLRALVASRIEAAVGSNRMLGVLQGLAVGDTQAMSAEQWRIFRATGTTHLMAISGLHISMVAALAAWLGGAIVRWRGAQVRGWTAMHGQVIAGVSAAVLYCALAGMSVPTQRTLIMLCIYFASRWWRRELSVGHALGLALIGVLIVDPFAPLAVGAWLSFGAVSAILLAMSGRLARHGAIRTFWRVQIAVTIGLIPLLLSGFGSMSLVSPFANALAVPLFTLIIVPAVLLGALAACIYVPAGTLILSLPVGLLGFVWPFFEWLADLPGSVWYFPQPSLPAFMALLAGVLLVILPGIWPTRLAGALLFLPVILSRPPTPEPGEFELALLDVGQGLSAVVRTRSHVLVFDAGPAFRSGRDAGELAVLPYLHYRGVRKLDALVISHGDLDHRGGMNSILAAIPVREVMAGPTVKGLPAAAGPCRRDQRWIWDGVSFEFLHPDGLHRDGRDGAHAADNDTSCVLSIRGETGSVLLTGDIEAAAETQLVDQGLPHADVVVVPHHGSRTSSGAPFVQAVHPKLALISAGYRNRWGFPRAEVVERWHATGARILTTIDSGAIEVSFEYARAPGVREYRCTHARYWKRPCAAVPALIGAGKAASSLEKAACGPLVC